MSDLMLDVDQAGELKAAFRRGGWSNAEIKRACEGDLLKHFRDVVRGLSAITPIPCIIDCDASPFVSAGWHVEEHTRGGIFTWDPAHVKLHLSTKQSGNECIVGDDLLRELAKKPTLNANVLDYLLAHPELIPEEWKNKRVTFWGTIYCNSHGSLGVRYLYWHGSAWNWDFSWVGYGFNSLSPALVRAS